MIKVPMNHNEDITEDFGIQLLALDSIVSKASPYQCITVADSPTFGRTLILDGKMRCTQLDGYIYHEVMAHTALLGHGCAKSVLVIGG